MRYVSTRGRAPVLGFDDVLVAGLAEDGGLYVPDHWPRLDPAVIDGKGSYAEVAEVAMAPFVAGSVVEQGFSRIVTETYAGFRHPDVAPLRLFPDGRHVLELFWGPTLSFKDYALQLVGRLFDEVLSHRGTRVVVLGATSGDTGSAAIEACRDREAIDAVILYPEGRLSEVQRRQMTTVQSPNVCAVAVKGTFDDCQDLVKAAFADDALRRQVGLAAVNSINWARVMAQTAYYAWTWAKLGRPFVVSVPTGNFGNVFAALAAQRMGVALEKIVVANNANHGLADLVTTGRLVRGDVVPTLAPAMDIQVPSNLERYLFELNGRDPFATAAAIGDLRTKGAVVLPEVIHAQMRTELDAAWYDDVAIEETIARVHATTGELLDPHTATAWAAADGVGDGSPVVTVATAHPAKFPEAVRAATAATPRLPADLADLMERPERIRTIPVDLEAVAGILRERHRP